MSLDDLLSRTPYPSIDELLETTGGLRESARYPHGAFADVDRFCEWFERVKVEAADRGMEVDFGGDSRTISQGWIWFWVVPMKRWRRLGRWIIGVLGVSHFRRWRIAR